MSRQTQTDAAGATTLNIIPIDDPEDPRIAAYRDIRERDLVGRQGLFIAEGSVVLQALATSNQFEAESVLVLENRVSGLAVQLEIFAKSIPIYVANRHCIDRVAGFPMHRGVLAIGRRRAEQTTEALLVKIDLHALVVVCIGISNHDNIGAIFRNAAAFGASAVLCDATCCDPLYRKAIRVSVGAVLKVPFARFDDSTALVEELSQRDFQQIALSPSGTTELKNIHRAPRTAIFLGAEGPGLPTRLINRMTSARIQMAPDFDSLNVAAASAIALHCLSN